MEYFHLIVINIDYTGIKYKTDYINDNFSLKYFVNFYSLKRDFKIFS